MKKVFVLIAIILGCFLPPSAGADPEAILTEVIDGIHRIPLTDGYSLFGDPIHSGSECFQLDRIDNEGEYAAHQNIVFCDMLNKRLKKKGYWPWTKDEYYTAEDFLTVYRDLAERACRLNPDALNFFRTLLLHGNVYQTPLPGLKESPDRITRGKWFDTVFELRFRRKADTTSAALIAIRDELASRAPTAAPPRDDAATITLHEAPSTVSSPAASGGGRQDGLRRRRASSESFDLSGDDHSDGHESTESDPLLGGHKKD
jgi:hypothetical protein